MSGKRRSDQATGARRYLRTAFCGFACALVWGTGVVFPRVAGAANLSGTIHYSGSMGPISNDVPIGMLLFTPVSESPLIVNIETGEPVSTNPGNFMLQAAGGTYGLFYYLDVLHTFANDPDQPAVGAPYQFYDHKFEPFGDPISVPQSGLQLDFDDSHLIPGIAGEVTYTGNQSDCITVEAFTDAALTDLAAEYDLKNCVRTNARYELLFLDPGQAYYLRACADLDGSESCDPGEPSTVYCHSSSPPGDPVIASSTQTHVNFSFGDTPGNGGCTLPEATATPTSGVSATPTASAAPSSTATALSGTPTPVPSATATATLAPLTVAGTCRAPGSAGLEPCAAATTITVYACSTDLTCNPDTLTMLDSTTVGDDGTFGFVLDTALVRHRRLVFVATFDGGAARRGRAAAQSTDQLLVYGLGPGGAGQHDDVVIDPSAAAAAELMAENGLQNYSNDAIAEITQAVRDATANLSYAGLTPSAALMLAVDTARQDSAVQQAIEKGTGSECIGDCDGSGVLAIDDLVTLVNIALGSSPLSSCLIGDANHDGQISISDLVRAVGVALDKCGSPTAAG
jgi:hypothetical protein